MKAEPVRIGRRLVGPGFPVYLIAEIGINHNGDLGQALRLIDLAAVAGFDAVKFQKREPELSVPEEQKSVPRETPWGRMPYIEYRRRLEFGALEYEAIDRRCRERGLDWFASAWDPPSLEFLERFAPVCHKVASACLTDLPLLRGIAAAGRPVFLSTGMSTLAQIRRAVLELGPAPLVLMHNTSTYPCPPAQINLRAIETLRRTFGRPVGYSGHEVGLQTTYGAVALGACAVERHITLDRSQWGSDHQASVEGTGALRLVRDIRILEQALGDGVKRVYESELPVMARLRKPGTPPLVVARRGGARG